MPSTPSIADPIATPGAIDVLFDNVGLDEGRRLSVPVHLFDATLGPDLTLLKVLLRILVRVHMATTPVMLTL